MSNVHPYQLLPGFTYRVFACLVQLKLNLKAVSIIFHTSYFYDAISSQVCNKPWQVYAKTALAAISLLLRIYFYLVTPSYL